MKIESFIGRLKINKADNFNIFEIYFGQLKFFK